MFVLSLELDTSCSGFILQSARSMLKYLAHNLDNTVLLLDGGYLAYLLNNPEKYGLFRFSFLFACVFPDSYCCSVIFSCSAQYIS